MSVTKCPWCGGMLKDTTTTEVNQRTHKVETVPFAKCEPCGIEAPPTWWTKATQDRRGLPVGDR